MNRLLVFSNFLLLWAVLILCAAHQVGSCREQKSVRALEGEIKRLQTHAALEHVMRHALQYRSSQSQQSLQVSSLTTSARLQAKNSNKTHQDTRVSLCPSTPSHPFVSVR